MQTPLFVCPLTADERAPLETGLRAPSAFTVRRCQILLASAEGQPTTVIAGSRRGPDQTVRNVIHAFHARGLTVLQPLSSRPHTTSTIFDAEACESLRALLHQSPRTFGQPTSRCTRARRRGQFRPRSHTAAGQRRNSSTGPAPIAGVREAGPAVDDQSRSSLSSKKKRRDRLSPQAMTHPTWALG